MIWVPSTIHCSGPVLSVDGMACLLRNGLAGALAGAGRGKVAMGGWHVTCARYMGAGIRWGPSSVPRRHQGTPGQCHIMGWCQHGPLDHCDKNDTIIKITLLLVGWWKVFCRFFPNCMDEEECLYEHEENNSDVNRNGSFCLNGSKCVDQSCRFSEQSHMNDRVLCKFQSKCNRLNCNYKHVVTRNAFLEDGQSNSKRK